MNKKVAVELKNVTKSFLLEKRNLFSLKILSIFFKKPNNKNTFTAVDNVSFKVFEGETVGLWGSNGSGKSTILKLIANLYTPNTGEVIVKQSVASVLELGIGLHPELTGRENVFFYSSILGISKKEIKSNYKNIIDFFGFKKFEDVPIKKYSSGMKSRLAFSIIAFSNADILLLDEVVATGDMEFTEKALNKIKNLKNKKTIIFTSHNYTQMQQLCDRVISLKNGKIVNNSNPVAINFLKNLDNGVEFEAKALSNSMEPKIYTGDILRIKKVPFNNLKIGDIIAFSFINIDEIIVHRIVAIKIENNKVIKVYTKGDFSSQSDPWEVCKSNYIGNILKIKRISN